MASRSNGHAIIFYPVVSIFLFFPHLISAVGDCSLPYFYTWYGLSANLECMSGMSCTWLSENKWRKNYAKNRRLRTITKRLATSSQLRHVSTITKNFLNINTSSRCLHNMANFGPLTGEICLQWRDRGGAEGGSCPRAQQVRGRKMAVRRWEFFCNGYRPTMNSHFFVTGQISMKFGGKRQSLSCIEP